MNAGVKGQGDWIWFLVANHVRVLMSTSGKWGSITHWDPLKTWRKYHKNSLRFFSKQKNVGYVLSANIHSTAQNPAQKYAFGEKNTIRFSKILFHQWLNFLMSTSGNFRLSIESDLPKHSGPYNKNSLRFFSKTKISLKKIYNKNA